MAPNEVVTNRRPDHPARRRAMVDCQVRTFDVTDQAVLAAMYDVPRELFVAPQAVSLAYADAMLPSLGGKRQQLAPMVLARMIQAAQLDVKDRVLDVAGGAGYSAAVLARIVASVTTLEEEPALTEAARGALAQAGAAMVSCVSGPLSAGYAAGAPYSFILINGAIEQTPEVLLGQLADGGRLVAVDASAGAPHARLYERIGQEFGTRWLFNTAAPVLEGFHRAPTFVF